MPRYDTQIISPHIVAFLYRWIIWGALAASFTVSVLGNIRPFGGDVLQLAKDGWVNWAYLRSGPFLWALGAAAISQLIIQVFQFRYAADPSRWRMYLTLIGVSVVLSLYTYAPVLFLINNDRRIGYVWLFLGAAIPLGLNDFLQERALQKRR